MPRKKETQERIRRLEKLFREILQTLGFDLRNQHLKDTPKRAALLWWKELGDTRAPRNIFRVFKSEQEGMVSLLDHKTFTRCPHHLERVELTVNIAYIPDGYVIGASKLARLADYLAHGLVTQEDFTQELGETLQKLLKPKGVIVVVDGIHFCMRARGVKTQGSMRTSYVTGVFLDEGRARDEALTLFFGGVK